MTDQKPEKETIEFIKDENGHVKVWIKDSPELRCIKEKTIKKHYKENTAKWLI